MEGINIKEFNKLFRDELNKKYLIKKYLGSIQEKDIFVLHYMFSNFMFRTLWSHFPTVINFGKIFSFKSKPKNVVDYWNGHSYSDKKRNRNKVNNK